MDSTLVIEIAKALFKQEWPFYEWDTQGPQMQFKYLQRAESLLEALNKAGLVIVKVVKE